MTGSSAAGGAVTSVVRSHSVTWEPVSTRCTFSGPMETHGAGNPGPSGALTRADVQEPRGWLVPKALSVPFLSCPFLSCLSTSHREPRLVPGPPTPRTPPCASRFLPVTLGNARPPESGTGLWVRHGHRLDDRGQTTWTSRPLPFPPSGMAE